MPTLNRSENTVVPLPGGKVLHVTGLLSADGAAYRLNGALGGTNSLQSWAIAEGSAITIGPYAEDENILVVCEIGGIDFTVEAFTGGGSGGGTVASVNTKTGAVQLTAADIGAVPAPSSYQAGAVHFSRTTSRLMNSALACADTRLLSFSFWVKRLAIDGGLNIWCSDPANTGVFCDFDSPNGIRTNITDAPWDNSLRFGAVASDDKLLGGFNHILGTLQIFDDTMKVEVYVNGQRNTSVAWANSVGFNIPLNGRPFILGESSALSGEEGANMLLADFWFAPGVSLFENGAIPEATLRKFIDINGFPVDLGSNGQLPTGAAPAVYLHIGRGAAASDFATNHGTGGAFSITGSLGASTISPTDSALGFPNPMTTAGDMIVGGASGEAIRLANPGAGTFNLRSIDGVLTWVVA
jgi:hypothetical protein